MSSFLKKHRPWGTPVEPATASVTSALLSILCPLSSVLSLVIEVQYVAMETSSGDSDRG